MEEIFTNEMLSNQNIQSKAQATEFMQSIDVTKPLKDHVIPWMLQFNMITEDKTEWTNSMNQMIKSYNLLVSKHITDAKYPDATFFEKNLDIIIPRDIRRSLKVFQELFKPLKMDLNVFPEPYFRFNRMFFLFIKDIPDFSFLQGYSHIVYIFAFIVIMFCTQFEIEPDIIEAITYHMSKFFLSTLCFGKDVQVPTKAEDIFGSLSVQLQKTDQALYKTFQEQKLEPKEFALNWYLLLFALQYKIDQLLVVWDHIILNIDTFQNYVNILCIAHLKQIHFCNDPEDTLQQICTARDFNLPKLFNDVEEILKRENNSNGNQKNIKKISIKNSLLFILIMFLIIYTLLAMLKNNI